MGFLNVCDDFSFTDDSQDTNNIVSSLLDSANNKINSTPKL